MSPEIPPRRSRAPLTPARLTDRWRRGRRSRAPLTPGLLALVGAGSALGALTRYALGSTLTANIVGAFLLGLTGTWLLRTSHNHLRVFLGAGLCGGLTTYSTFVLDALTAPSAAAAIGYVATTLAAGLIAAALGVVAAR